jgi:hypothetical protein
LFILFFFKRIPVHVGYEAGWTPGPVWTVYRKNLLSLPGIKKGNVQPLPTKLLRLPNFIEMSFKNLFPSIPKPLKVSIANISLLAEK